MQTRGINSISRDYHVLRVRRLLPNKVGKGRVLRSGSQKRIPHPFSANRFPRENSQGVHQSIRFDGYFFSSLFFLFALRPRRTPQFRRIVNRAPRNGLKDTKKADSVRILRLFDRSVV